MATRRELIQAVLDRVRRTGEPVLAWDEVPGLAEEFGEPDTLLREMYRRWYARFAARLDAALEEGQADPVEAAREVYRRLATETPEWRFVLDAHRDHPALAEAERQRRGLSSPATGGRSAGPQVSEPPVPSPVGRSRHARGKCRWRRGRAGRGEPARARSQVWRPATR